MKKQFNQRAVALTIAAMSTVGLLTACGGSDAYTPPAGPGTYDNKLAFDNTKYTTITVTLNGVVLRLEPPIANDFMIVVHQPDGSVLTRRIFGE